MVETKEEVERKLMELLAKSKNFDIDVYLMEDTFEKDDYLKLLEEHIEFENNLKNALHSKIIIELDLQRDASRDGKTFDEEQWKNKIEADQRILRLIKDSDILNNKIKANISLIKQANRFNMIEQKEIIRKNLVELINTKKNIDQKLEKEMMLV